MSAEPVIYETQDWNDDQRMSFENLLRWAQVNFTWEDDGALSVDPKNESRVDDLLEQFTASEGQVTSGGALTSSANDLSEDEEEDDDETDDEEIDEEDEDEAEDDSVDESGFDKSFAALVSLFEASDQLTRDALDDRNRVGFRRAATAIGEFEPPFGWDDALWEFVCERAALLAIAVDDAIDIDVISIDARSLKDIIVRYL